MQKKIALLGAAGVGKTSLVRRFVERLFDDKYLTTIGVKIDKKVVVVGGSEITLMLWDVAGAEERFTIPSSYVRGAAGVVLVADGTRPGTLDDAFDILDQIRVDVGTLPYVLVLNKGDLADSWRIDDDAASSRASDAVRVLRTSARTGECVEEAFGALAKALMTAGV